jgi:predicted metalloprotease with PDZ domain
MKKISFSCLLWAICFQIIAQIKTNTPEIEYMLSMDQPHTHYLEVTMKVSNFDAKTKQNGFIDFKIAVWTPGSYLIREYAKNVEGLKAVGENGNLKSDKINKNTWRVRLQNSTNQVSVSYKVYANELSVRTSFIDDSHGYLNPASVLLYMNDWKYVPSKVVIKPFKNWTTISTALPEIAKNTFLAENLDVLIDSPIEIGTQKILTFDLKGIPHKISMYGEAKYDEQKVIKDFNKVCETAMSVVGEHPCKNYTFLIHNLNRGGGGLEHLNSTTCQTSRSSYENEKAYQGFLSLIAHEYFHLWNVKRIRPKALGPFDYENENYTHLLWLSEGCTSFYQNYILRRAGFMTPEDFTANFAKEISLIENQPGNKVQSATESSWDAWIKYYRPNENSKNSTISYYDKGSVLGGILNLLIIQNTNGKKNFDDVMKMLYQKYYKEQQRGFTDEELQKAVEATAGVPMNDFFQKYIFGTETLPYSDILKSVGMQIIDQNAANNDPFLGIEFRNGKIGAVLRDSPAYVDGLNVDDEILSVDGSKPEDLTKVMQSKKVGDSVSIKVKRDGLEKTFTLNLTRNQMKAYKIEAMATQTLEQLVLYKKWLYL